MTDGKLRLLETSLSHNCSSVGCLLPMPFKLIVMQSSYDSPKTNIERGAFELPKITMSIALSPILQVQSIWKEKRNYTFHHNFRLIWGIIFWSPLFNRWIALSSRYNVNLYTLDSATSFHNTFTLYSDFSGG